MKANILRLTLALVCALTIGGQRTVLSASPLDGGACTSFALDNNGYLVFGANYDNVVDEGLLFVNKRNVAKVGLDETLTVSANWVSRYGSVTFNPGTYQFVWGGMNEAGLMISTMALAETENPAPDERPALVSNIWVQYQLDNFATVAEVIASDSQIRIAGTVDHYLVCDRQGACAVIEFLAGEMVYYIDEALPVRVLTNSTYAESLAMWQTAAPLGYEPTDVRRTNPLHRFYVAASRVEEFDPDDEESAVDYAFDTLAQVGGSHIWSFVLDAENFQVYFHSLTNREIRSLSFEDLDFSCNTPVLMWDLFADDLSGDIADDLFEYSHDIVLENTLDYLEKREEGLDPALVNELLSGLEAAFRCTEAE